MIGELGIVEKERVLLADHLVDAHAPKAVGIAGFAGQAVPFAQNVFKKSPNPDIADGSSGWSWQ